MHLAGVVDHAERRSGPALALVDHVIGVAGHDQADRCRAAPACIRVEKGILGTDRRRRPPVLRDRLRGFRRTVEQSGARRVAEANGFDADEGGPRLIGRLRNTAQELDAAERNAAARRNHRRRCRRRAGAENCDARIVAGADRQWRERAEGQLPVAGAPRRLEVLRRHFHLQGRERKAVRLQQRRRQRHFAQRASRIADARPDLVERRDGADQVAVAERDAVRHERRGRAVGLDRDRPGRRDAGFAIRARRSCVDPVIRELRRGAAAEPGKGKAWRDENRLNQIRHGKSRKAVDFEKCIVRQWRAACYTAQA